MTIDMIRNLIDQIDNQIIKLLLKRFALVSQIAQEKKVLKKTLFDHSREKAIFDRFVMKSKSTKLDPSILANIYKVVLKESRQLQKKLL